MTYNPNIPRPDDLISESQGQILDNFGQLNTVFGQDHVKYDNATVGDRGKHNQSTYKQLSGDPATTADEMALYAKDDGSGNTRLFLKQETPTGTVIQLSGIDPQIADNGYTFLPGGLLMQWGFTAEFSGASIGVLFTTSHVDFPNNLFNVSITPKRDFGSPGSTYGFYVANSGFSITGFTIRNISGHTYGFQWMAIGN